VSDTAPSVFPAHALDRPVGNEPGAIRCVLHKPLSLAPDLAKLEGDSCAALAAAAQPPALRVTLSNQIKGARTGDQRSTRRCGKVSARCAPQKPQTDEAVCASLRNQTRILVS
jgi:hypothetical protein